MSLKEQLAKCRNSKGCRMGFIVALMVIVLLLIFFWKKATGFLIVILVILALALGLEGFDYDADLGKLWETKNYNESRVETIKDSEGNSVRVITGNCNRKQFDMNCSSFSTQGQAQAKYQECADILAANNPKLDVKKLDVYGLDGDNDGIVCESLATN